jgi:hypothetical protein
MHVVITSAGFAALVSLTVLANSFDVPPQQPPPPDAGKERLKRNPALESRGNTFVPKAEVSLIDENEIAGIARGTRSERLTWEMAYKLAVVRARAGRGALMQTLDAAALDRQAEQLGMSDFAGFRKDFLGGGSFREPSAQMLALLGRLQAIENSRRRSILLGNLAKLLQERAQDPVSGLSALDIDSVGAAIARATQSLDHQKRLFRDGLDELKVALGLSLQAAVVLDRDAALGFQDVFGAVANWQRHADRDPRHLTVIIDRLPPLGDVILDGQPVLRTISPIDAPSAEDSAKLTRLALENRAKLVGGSIDVDERTRLELLTRSRLRRLCEARLAYDEAKSAYVLAQRIIDQAYERLLAPSFDGAANRSLSLERCLKQIDNATTIEDKLVDHWTSFRSDRLVLYREIGALPYADWKSFHADLIAPRESDRARSN